MRQLVYFGWKTHAMCNQSKCQLYDDVLWLGYENIVAQRLLFSPLTNWISYQLVTDMSQGFGIDYFVTSRAMSHQITFANVLSHRRTMPNASDYAPVHININSNFKLAGKVKSRYGQVQSDHFHFWIVILRLHCNFYNIFSVFFKTKLINQSILTIQFIIP